MYLLSNNILLSKKSVPIPNCIKIQCYYVTELLRQEFRHGLERMNRLHNAVCKASARNIEDQDHPEESLCSRLEQMWRVGWDISHAEGQNK